MNNNGLRFFDTDSATTINDLKECINQFAPKQLGLGNSCNYPESIKLKHLQQPQVLLSS